jgi:hypothetical protein
LQISNSTAYFRSRTLSPRAKPLENIIWWRINDPIWIH